MEKGGREKAVQSSGECLHHFHGPESLSLSPVFGHTEEKRIRQLLMTENSETKAVYEGSSYWSSKISIATSSPGTLLIPSKVLEAMVRPETR